MFFAIISKLTVYLLKRLDCILLVIMLNIMLIYLWLQAELICSYVYIGLEYVPDCRVLSHIIQTTFAFLGCIVN